MLTQNLILNTTIVTYLIVWSLLVAIGVSDAKAHRIPNRLLIFLLLTLCLSTLSQASSEILLSVFWDKSIAFGVTFVFGLVLYLLRVMAPGDVKFVAVLGFYLGTDELVSYLYYVCVTIVFVGPMYWLMNRLQLSLKSGASRRQKISSSLTGMIVSLELGKQELSRNISTGNNLTYMPFAPILIIGLAIHQYYA